MVGSAITWKYPSIVMKGDDMVGEFYSVSAVTEDYQLADMRTKMIHVGKNSRRKIIGLVQVRPQAENTRNFLQCDSILVGYTAGANSYPFIQMRYQVCLLQSMTEHATMWAFVPQHHAHHTQISSYTFFMVSMQMRYQMRYQVCPLQSLTEHVGFCPSPPRTLHPNFFLYILHGFHADEIPSMSATINDRTCYYVLVSHSS